MITKANEGSTKYRNGPDVTANANFTFYVCSDQVKTLILAARSAERTYMVEPVLRRPCGLATWL